MNAAKVNANLELDVIAGFSHEIKNPLNATMTGAFCLNNYIGRIKEIMSEKHIISKEHNEITSLLNDSQKAVSLINEGNNRIKQVLSNLQSNNRSEDESNEIYNIKSEVESCILLFSKQLDFNNITTEIKIDNQIYLLCNKSEINQVITNLIINSCEAMPNGGKISILCENSDDKAIIRFSDNGPGISQEFQTSIFEPYFTTKSAKENLGFGLYVSKKIIERHGGELLLENKDAGTTFIIKLNLTRDYSTKE